MVSSCDACGDRYRHVMHVMIGVIMKCMLMMDIITHRLWNKVISRNACDDRCHYPMRVMRVSSCTAGDNEYHPVRLVMNGIIMHCMGSRVSSCNACDDRCHHPMGAMK